MQLEQRSPPKVFVVAPTFKEPGAVSHLIECFSRVTYPNYEILLVNGNPDDETSAILRNQTAVPVRELRGTPDRFWSGLQNIGLQVALREGGPDDRILMMNVDVSFSTDIISSLVEIARTYEHCQLGAVSCSNDRVISSGVRVRSWLLALNQHPYSGWRLSDMPSNIVEAVTFLPGRCLLFPLIALHKSGIIAERWLPHYAADYEFSNRLRRCGFPGYLCTNVRVNSDVHNTGNDVYRKQTNLLMRLRKLTNIKTPYNPYHRLVYIWLTYPAYAIPTASLSYFSRTLLELFWGGSAIKKLFKGPGHGFSG